MLYLTVAQVLDLHVLQLRRYGGGAGLRDRGALESAVVRAQMTFGGEDLYADAPAKAAALMHSLVTNHPLVDGDKRVGVHAALLFLRANEFAIEVSPPTSPRSLSPWPAAKSRPTPRQSGFASDCGAAKPRAESFRPRPAAAQVETGAAQRDP